MSVARHTHRTPSRLVALALAGGLALAGCGGEDPATSATSDEAADDASVAETDDAAAPVDETGDATAEDPPADDDDGVAAEGICGLLDGVDLTAAFEDTLALGAPTSTAPDNCVVPIEGAEGSGFFIRTFDASFYELKLEAAESSGAEVRNPDLGQGAVLVGNGDLTVLVDDETTLYTGVEAFFTEFEPPSDDVFRNGVTTVAAQVLANL